MQKIIDSFKHGLQFFFIDAGLRRFPGEIDLHQNVLHFADFSRFLVQDLRKLRGIYGMNQVKKAHGILRLVFLQMTDEVPDSISLKRRKLFPRFLNTIFTDVRHAARDRLAHLMNLMIFRHRHKPNRLFRIGKFSLRPALFNGAQNDTQILFDQFTSLLNAIHAANLPVFPCALR